MSQNGVMKLPIYLYEKETETYFRAQCETQCCLETTRAICVLPKMIFLYIH